MKTLDASAVKKVSGGKGGFRNGLGNGIGSGIVQWGLDHLFGKK